MYLKTKNYYLDLSNIKIMGILNITPDSFFDGGKYYKNINKSIDHTHDMIKNGAKIIDVGGESTRPGSKEVSVDEELDRVIPIIDAISQRFDVWISVDTSKLEVIKEACNIGVHIINDVRLINIKDILNIVKKKKYVYV